MPLYLREQAIRKGWRKLCEATNQGNINESVAIEVECDGKRMQLFVPRGPQGIRTSSASQAAVRIN